MVFDQWRAVRLQEPAIQRTLFATLLLLLPASLIADPVPVRLTQGSAHGYLTLRTLDGKLLATGDLTQIAHNERITSRLTFHFRDGSLDDETTIFTQKDIFHLISDRHIQRGPSFPKPMESFVEANGNITMRDLARNGGDSHDKVESSHIDLPADTYNGMALTILNNIAVATPETRIAYVAPMGKGRLIHLSMKPVGEETFRVGFIKRKATIFNIRIELGGVAGVVAPVVGKQPDDARVWISGGECPAFVKEEGQLFQGGPVWRIELTSAAFPGENRPVR